MGQRFLNQVPTGFLYIEHTMAMVVLKRSAAEVVLRRFHDFFVYLEGILRRMKPENSRRADLPTFETEDECRHVGTR